MRVTQRSTPIVALAALVLGIAVFMLGGLHHILESQADTLAAARLVRGRAHHLLFESSTWTSAPVGPWSGGFYNLRAMLIMVPLMVITAVVIRFILRRTWLLAGWVALAAPILPYVIALIALSPNDNPATAATWLEAMLCCMAYGSLFSVAFVTVHLVRTARSGNTGTAGLEICHACGKSMAGHGGSNCPHCGALRLLSD